MDDNDKSAEAKQQRKLQKATEYFQQLVDDPFDKREPIDKWRRACIVFRLPRNLKMPKTKSSAESTVERYATDRPGGLVW